MRRDLLLKLIALVLAPPEPKPELVDPLTFVRNLVDVAARQSPEHRAGLVAAFGASIACNIADAHRPEAIP